MQTDDLADRLAAVQTAVRHTLPDAIEQLRQEAIVTHQAGGNAQACIRRLLQAVYEQATAPLNRLWLELTPKATP